MAVTARPAAFFDKDGTLVEDVPYNIDPGKVRLATGAVAALRLVQEAGFDLFIVSNQSGVARGHFPESALSTLREHLARLLAGHGVRLAGFAYCPHYPQAAIPRYARECRCRKPRPGMLRRLARRHHLDLRASWLIGDILDDVETGLSAGCRTVLLANGNEREWRTGSRRWPHFIASDLLEAAELIVCAGPSRPSPCETKAAPQ
jgi:D,D-heptose 1,7-bisphosphate phosphatase